ncbi:MAG: hypothetical protein ACWGO1_10570, partial [Anaerolineales bacterium]
FVHFFRIVCVDHGHDLLEEIQVSRLARGPMVEIRQKERWQTPIAGSTQSVTQRYRPGMRVYHPVWDVEGMVLNSRIQDDDEIVDIFFEDLGLKHLAASLARLEIR